MCCNLKQATYTAYDVKTVPYVYWKYHINNVYYVYITYNIYEMYNISTCIHHACIINLLHTMLKLKYIAYIAYDTQNTYQVRCKMQCNVH